jgi:hypothetical protein
MNRRFYKVCEFWGRRFESAGVGGRPQFQERVCRHSQNNCADVPTTYTQRPYDLYARPFWLAGVTTAHSRRFFHLYIRSPHVSRRPPHKEGKIGQGRFVGGDTCYFFVKYMSILHG